MQLFNIVIILASIVLTGAIYYTGQRNREAWRKARFPSDFEEQKEAYRAACLKYDEMMRKK